jgi:hypothetical protein
MPSLFQKKKKKFPITSPSLLAYNIKLFFSTRSLLLTLIIPQKKNSSKHGFLDSSPLTRFRRRYITSKLYKHPLVIPPLFRTRRNPRNLLDVLFFPPTFSKTRKTRKTLLPTPEPMLRS